MPRTQGRNRQLVQQPSIEERLCAIRYSLAVVEFVAEAERDGTKIKTSPYIWAGVVTILRDAHEHLDHLSSLPASILNLTGKEEC